MVTLVTWRGFKGSLAMKFITKEIFIILLILSPNVFGDWERVAANSLLVADWSQTRYIATSDDYIEYNKILGTHPTLGEVDKYFIGYIATVNLIGENLDFINLETYRDTWYLAVAVHQLAYVVHNRQIGIQFKF